MFKKTRWGFALVALILGGCIYFLYSAKFILGIDLRGGTELVYKLDLSRVEEEGAQIAEEVKDMIAKRLDLYGLKEISIAVQGTDRLVVQLPGASDSQEVENLKRQVEQSGNLQFMLVAEQEYQSEPEMAKIEQTEAEYLKEDRAWFEKKRRDPNFNETRPEPPEFIVRWEVESKEEEGRTVSQKQRKYVLHNGEEYKVSGDFLNNASSTYDENGLPAVSFNFNTEGATKFANLTGPNKGRLLAILLDDDIRQVATIRSRIYDSGQLTGSFTHEEVRGIVTLLKAGSLKTKPTLDSERTVGAALGHDSIRSGTIAMAAGLLGVLAFMAIYYLAGGMIANFALVFNIIIILSYVVVFRQTLTFPGIAGILLTIGMAVDANILIFERIREELAKGKSLLHSMGAGYQRAFWVIFDSNLTTVLVGIVLFRVGTGPVKGFAVTLIAGIVASFFTAVFVTRLILSFLYNVRILKRLSMLKVFSPPRVDYVSYRKYFVGLSVAAIIATWALFVIPRGMRNYGIDFTGGTRITMNLNRSLGMAELRSMIDSLPPEEQALFLDYSIQTQNATERGKASSFSLLTRTEEENIAEAQEKEEEPVGPPAIDDASPPEKSEEKSTPDLPAESEGKAAEEAGEAAETKEDIPPAEKVEEKPEAPAAPEPEKSPPQLATEESEQPEDTRSKEARRVTAIRNMLFRNYLLLPDAFSEPEWREGTPAGSEYLSLTVNLLDTANDFNLVDGRPLSTPEAIRERLNKHFEQHSNPHFKGTEGGFKGIRIEKVDPLTSAPVEESDSGKIQVSSFQIITQPYTEPLPGVDDAVREAPFKQEVVSEIKAWFRDLDILKLSEPIPEVLSVGPKVANDLQATAIIAVFISMLGIMFYMALRFELMYGVAGIIALAHDVLIVIGVMAMTDALLGETFSIKINLPELAAFLTIIGFSINDTIVVFDRIWEMLRIQKRKLEYKDVVNAAVNQTLSRTIWTSLTTLVVTLALLLFAGETIRGFSYAFAIGVVTGCYSSVFVASPVVVYMQRRQVERRERLLAETGKS